MQRFPTRSEVRLSRKSSRQGPASHVAALLVAFGAVDGVARGGDGSTPQDALIADPCDRLSVGVLDIALLSMRDRAVNGDCDARCVAAMQLLSGELGFRDKALAHAVLRELSTAGCPRAMLYWGRILLEGAGTPAAPEEATRLLRSAGEAGEAVAWGMLNRAYARGEGVARDDRLAAECAEKAVQANFAPTVMDRAVMSLASDTEPSKIATAVATIRKLAESGYSRAQAALARFYITGENGFPRDVKFAGVWGERAALQGEPLGFGAYAASLMDAHGPGTEGFRKAVMFVYLGAQVNDRVTLKWWGDLMGSLPASEIRAAQALAREWTPVPSEASRWWIWCITSVPTGELSLDERQELDQLERLADAGDPAASAAVAEEYFHGLARPRNRAKAGELLLLAARAGNPISQRAVGRMYLWGCGLERAPRQAAYWFQIAADQGLADTKGFQEACGLLSIAERESVLEEAKAFVPSKSPRRP